MAISLGIVGLGQIGKQHLECARGLTEFAVSAVADPAVAERAISGVTCYQRWEEMLAHPGIDAVSICTPHCTHAPIALAVLRGGKHVLLEKPLAMDAAQAADIIEAARRFGRVLMVELTHRFYPPVQQAGEQVRSGRVGKIYAVEDRVVLPGLERGPSWFQQKSRAGGGVALTNGIHMLDRVSAVTGQALQFQCGSAGYSARLGDVEDTAAMLLSLEDGTPVQILASCPRGNAALDDELTVYGTKGTLRVWAWRGWRFEPLSGDEPPEEKLCYPADEDVQARVRRGVRGALAEFAAAVREGREPRPPASAALAAQGLLDQFYQSLKT